MHFIYTLTWIYPYWAIPSMVIFFELGIFFYRKGSRLYYFLFGLIGLLAVGILLWLFYRGDKNSEKWVRSASSLQEEVRVSH